MQVAASTLKKYIDIVCDILTNRDKLFNTYISIPSGVWLQAIIEDFRDITGLPNIYSAIDGIHILLIDHPKKRVSLTTSDFFNRKKFQSIVL